MSQHPNSSVTRVLISHLLTRNTGVTSYSLDMGRYEDGDSSNEWLARSLKCREYLLEAGADPTLTTGDGSSALGVAISGSNAMDPNESVSRVPLLVKANG